jgi:hypothetical protein
VAFLFCRGVHSKELQVITSNAPKLLFIFPRGTLKPLWQTKSPFIYIIKKTMAEKKCKTVPPRPTRRKSCQTRSGCLQCCGTFVTVVVLALAIFIGVMMASPSTRQQLFAKFLTAATDKFNEMTGEYKYDLFATVPQEGRVVEIGPGSGANFPFFPTRTDNQGRKGKSIPKDTVPN